MLNELKSGLSRAWDNLAEGWSHLQERAGEAITRFHPVQPAGDRETEEDRTVRGAARWSLLAAEVRDDADEVLVKLEVPGMDSSDFDIEVRDGRLLVSGHKHVEREEKRGSYYVMERAYGRFERALPLPAEVDDSKAKARYARGVLSIRLPKRPEARARRITVTRG